MLHPARRYLISLGSCSYLVLESGSEPRGLHVFDERLLAVHALWFFFCTVHLIMSVISLCTKSREFSTRTDSQERLHI